LTRSRVCLRPSSARRAVAEFLGTAALAVAVVGSSLAAARLTEDAGLQLLINAVSTGGALAVLILVLGPISGSQLNPLVSLVDLALGARPVRGALAAIGSQLLGALAGILVAHLMFGAQPLTVSSIERLSAGSFVAEVVATAGLLFVIFALIRHGRLVLIAPAVGVYIAGAYFFTSSTSFANPALTLGRTLTESSAGIAPASGMAFVGAQCFGALVGYALVRLLVPIGRGRVTSLSEASPQ
jgi:glycerol uptake facilitator-like aquaporin